MGLVTTKVIEDLYRDMDRGLAGFGMWIQFVWAVLLWFCSFRWIV